MEEQAENEFQQEKLQKSEWESIEIPVSTDELQILRLIINGFHNVNIRHNNTLSLISFMKIEPDPKMIDFIYTKYFQQFIKDLTKKYKIPYTIKVSSKVTIKKKDQIRIANTEINLERNKPNIYEYIILDLVKNLLQNFKLYNESRSITSQKKYLNKWLYYYYSIQKLLSYSIFNSNKHVTMFITKLLEIYRESVNFVDIVYNASEIIEKNQFILQHKDIGLYSHQKTLFTLCKQPNPKLVLYIAPTGTGKTLSPIGLAETHRIIFVCAARHVGLALARSAISVGRKVAFAFGCRGTEDIRLHYSAVKECIRDWKTGGIRKVDNSIGDNVEIMICDLRSYRYAMLYMTAFNSPSDLIMYWDEPTISLDYDEHALHTLIQNNWKENLIPNIILSSATLPKEHEIQSVINGFKTKFLGASIETIISHDCIKTISILNKTGQIELPHYLFESYDELQESVQHCEEYPTLLRYLDLSEIVKFLNYVIENKYIKSRRLEIGMYFDNILNITMDNIKSYYLKILKKIKEADWLIIYNYFKDNRQIKMASTIHITTRDAVTLTEGPTIYMTNDVDKIAQFCVQTAKIPQTVMDTILDSIYFNNELNNRIMTYEKDLEDGLAADEEKEKKMTDCRIKPELKRLMETIDGLRRQVRSVTLNNLFIPNTRDHQEYWHTGNTFNDPFVGDISEKVVERIMLLHGLPDMWKILLLMGIGVFRNSADNENIVGYRDYAEVMKELADTQKLYLIIASTDYIYGTNYQFCHGYLGKDLNTISQEKSIQAMGRIGRNKLQKQYTIRFRDNEIIKKIFSKCTTKPEVNNMNKLFVSGDI
jgi:hypothetical protein